MQVLPCTGPERLDHRRVDSPTTEQPVKIGIIGTGSVGCACAMAAVTRGSAREIVLVNRNRKTAEAVATDMRWRWQPTCATARRSGRKSTSSTAITTRSRARASCSSPRA
ncbi:MAG: hypothetical protein E6G80_20555 [Alphaproteobacteria bacterium]|nr:MAG: hypothetical protein E6G80_20555 [Alphaproteobacteria bacterium]